MQESNMELEKFGEFITRNLRDNGIDYFDALLTGLCRTTSFLQLEEYMKEFYLEQIKVIRKCVVKTLDNAIHDFLCSIRNNSCSGNDIAIIINGKDISKASECLEAEPYSGSGWYAKFSKFGEFVE